MFFFFFLSLTLTCSLVPRQVPDHVPAQFQSEEAGPGLKVSADGGFEFQDASGGGADLEMDVVGEGWDDLGGDALDFGDMTLEAAEARVSNMSEKLSCGESTVQKFLMQR